MARRNHYMLGQTGASPSCGGTQLTLMLDRVAEIADVSASGFADMFSANAPAAVLKHMRSRRI